MDVRIRFKYPKKPIRMIKGRDLVPHPGNWRTHPAAQLDALKGIMAEVGIVDCLKGFELPDKRVQLIDGHARAELLPDQEFPVLILDVTAEEAKKLLATFDPLGDLAGTDAAKLDDLLRQVEFESPALLQMCNELAVKNGLAGDQDAAAEDENGAAGNEPIPEKYQILVEFDDEQTQAQWLEKLAAEGLKVRSLIS